VCQRHSIQVLPVGIVQTDGLTNEEIPTTFQITTTFVFTYVPWHMLGFNCIRRVVPVVIQVGTPPVTSAHRVGLLVQVNEHLIVLVVPQVLSRPME
jgi:hypothetical protein